MQKVEVTERRKERSFAINQPRDIKQKGKQYKDTLTVGLKHCCVNSEHRFMIPTGLVD